LQALHQRLSTTTLYVTHDQVEAMTLAHRMLVMNAGRSEQVGAPLEVYSRPASTFVAGFIGSPPMNLVEGTLVGGGTALAAEGDVRIRLPEPRPALDGRRVQLGVRPEHLESCEPAQALLTPDVDYVELLGSDSLVYGRLGADQRGARIAARLHMSIVARKGPLPLHFAAAHLHLFDPGSGQRIET
jgi:sn-glycerol 3-phosphate transport system ATP-binding protein